MQSHVSEEWRPIPGFPGYQASNMGRILGPQGVRKTRVGNRGYHILNVWKRSKSRPIRIHRMVLLAFVGPCPEGLETRHLDGNRDNNALSNLAYGTKLENGADKKRHGHSLTGEKNKNAKLTEEQVVDILRSIESGRTLARCYGVNRDTISNIRRGKAWGATTKDAIQPGRNQNRGEKNPRARITESDVRDIRQSAASNKTLASRYRLSPVTICNIRARRTWQHVA